MKKAIVASLAIFALGGSAMAADMGMPPPPAYKALPPPSPSWTGCYINAGGGYGMWNSKIHEEAFPALTPLTLDVNVGGEGWLGVAGGGCDYQFRAFNNWDVVVGAFGDFDLMDLYGVTNLPSTDLGGTTTERSAWAAGLRAGLLITPTLLTYINGGYTGTHVGQTNLEVLTPPGFPIGLDMPAHNFGGWFLGGGTEYALTWSWLPITGLFWRNEYRFSSYQSADLEAVATATGAPAGFGVHASNNDVQTITSSLVWRFNWTGH